jgi:hypothetical protein
MYIPLGVNFPRRFSNDFTYCQSSADKSPKSSDKLNHEVVRSSPRTHLSSSDKVSQFVHRIYCLSQSPHRLWLLPTGFVLKVVLSRIKKLRRSGPKMEGGKILCVEDDIFAMKVFSSMLKTLG